jgi:hypothetical protein
MNQLLLRVYNPKEVNHVLAQMHPLKAQGLDGYGVCFYHKHWNTIGAEVRQAILNFLNNGIFDPSINYTYLALIPKHHLPLVFVIIVLLAFAMSYIKSLQRYLPIGLKRCFP